MRDHVQQPALKTNRNASIAAHDCVLALPSIGVCSMQAVDPNHASASSTHTVPSQGLRAWVARNKRSEPMTNATRGPNRTGAVKAANAQKAPSAMVSPPMIHAVELDAASGCAKSSRRGDDEFTFCSMIRS